jgi:hybrid cluster-associated redox disulfide protein
MPKSESTSATPSADCVSIRRETLVAAVLRDQPATLSVFLRRGMHCPGCRMAPFMTLGEAAATYGLKADDLIAELRAAGEAQ